MMTTKNSQRGSTLVVGLVMLVVLTLLVISAIWSSNTNLRIAGNMQMQEEVRTAAQLAIEQEISNTAMFYTPGTRTVTLTAYPTYNVTVTPVCLRMTTAAGYSAQLVGITPQDTYWDIRATVTDTRTGATATLHQGIKVSLRTATSCPPP